MDDHPGFSYGKIAAIGSGFLGLTLVWSLYNTFMPLLLGDFIASRGLRGAIMGLDNLFALLIIPVVGAWSDRLRGPLGQRLPFIAIGMPLAALLFALVPLGKGTLLTLLGLDVLFLLAMTLYRAPVIALMPDHTPEERRSVANGVINLMGGIGGLLAFFVLAPLYDRAQGLPFLVGSALLLVAFAVLILVVDRHPPYVSSAAGDAGSPLGVLLREVRGLRAPRYRRARLILTAIFAYSLGFSGLEAQFSTYATENLRLSGGAAGLTLGFFSLAFIALAVPAGVLGARLGEVSTMRLGLIGLTLLFALLPFIGSPLVLRLLLALAGVGWALVNVQAYPLVADLGGLSRIGFFTGMYYLFSTAASTIAPSLIGLGMDLLGGASLFAFAGLAMFVGFLQLGRAQAA